MNFKSHHAHLIEGDPDGAVDFVCDAIEKEYGFPVTGNPDVWCHATDVFGVDESREVRNFSLLKPLGNHKCCVVAFQSITHEAQNSLLKVLEEPTADTSFFIVTPSKEILLPTLLSRLSVESFNTGGTKESSVTPDLFLKADKSKRLDMIAGVAKEKDVSDAVAFLGGVEDILHTRLVNNPADSESVYALMEVSRARKYLGGRSPNIKLILEHIALVLPTTGKKGKMIV